MSGWIIASWIFVALLTIGNVLFFLKLKKAADQMMSAAFPGAKNSQDAMMKAQQMMKGMNSQQMQHQMKAAMDMLAQMQKNQRR